jgi:hypothetical protein
MASEALVERKKKIRSYLIHIGLGELPCHIRLIIRRINVLTKNYKMKNKPKRITKSGTKIKYQLMKSNT